MPLQDQNIPIIFGKLDTKTDAKLVAPGSLVSLENAVSRNSGSYGKRYGLTPLTALDVSGATITGAIGVGTFNDELLQFANNKVYSYSESVGKWLDKGRYFPAAVQTTRRSANNYRAYQSDSACEAGVAVYATEAYLGTTGGSWSNIGVTATVVDEASGTTLLDVTLFGDGGRNPKCIAMDGYVYVFYCDLASGTGSKLYVTRISATSPTAFATPLLIASDLDPANMFDIAIYQDSRILFAYDQVSTGDIIAGWIGTSMTILTGSLAVATISGGPAVEAMNIIPGPGNRYFVTYKNFSDSKLYGVILDSNADVLVADFVIANAPGGGGSTAYTAMTGAALNDDTGIILFYETAPATAASRYGVRSAKITNAGAVTLGSSQFMESCQLWTRAWKNGTDIYVGVAYNSTLQASYFVLWSDGVQGSTATVVARQEYTLGIGLRNTISQLQNVWSAADGIYNYSLLVKTDLRSQNAKLFSIPAIAKTTLDFTGEGGVAAVQFGNNLHLSGGFLQIYDGKGVVESGFHQYPELAAATQSTTTGSIAPGIYDYVAVYEWTDAKGQRHQSATSIPLSVTVPAGTSTNKVTIPVKCLSLTAKRGTRSNVSIGLFRSTAGPGTTRYRVTSISSPTYNDPTAETVSIVDTISDTTLVGNEILYTAGGELDNWPAPACQDIRVWKNRLWLSGLEDENDVWFSKEHTDKRPVNFAEEQKKSVDPTGAGGVVATYPMDDKLLAFRSDTYLYTYGDGPNALGSGGEFADFIDIAATVGCTDRRSLVTLPEGVAVKTSKGLYTVSGTSLAAIYFGAPVADFEAPAIVGAVVVPDDNQVRFSTADGTMLVYDHFEQQWSTFPLDTDYAGVAATAYGLTVATVGDDGKIYLEDTTSFKDATAAVPILMALETGWIELSGIGGFVRARQLRIVGRYRSEHTIRISVAYDYNEEFFQVEDFNPDDMLEDPGTTGYRLRLDFQQQKCEAFKLRIEETTTDVIAGTQQGFEITAMSIYAGMKQGGSKYAKSQKIGS